MENLLFSAAFELNLLAFELGEIGILNQKMQIN
jgi:hypothetical protein